MVFIASNTAATSPGTQNKKVWCDILDLPAEGSGYPETGRMTRAVNPYSRESAVEQDPGG